MAKPIQELAIPIDCFAVERKASLQLTRIPAWPDSRYEFETVFQTYISMRFKSIQARMAQPLMGTNGNLLVERACDRG